MQWLNAIFIISKCTLGVRSQIATIVQVRKTMYRYGWAWRPMPL